MTFIDFKKNFFQTRKLLSQNSQTLLKSMKKNIQAYKKKGDVPNAIAVIAQCFASMHANDLNYKEIIKELDIEKKREKKGAGFF